MKRGSNDDDNEVGAPSIRLKYKAGRSSKSKINYGVVMKTSKHEFSEGGAGSGVKEEKIIIKKESKLNRGIAASPQESSSKITTKTVVQEGDGGKSRSQVTITKTEITSESQRGGNSSSNLREAKGSRVTSKTTEITTSSTMNATGGNRNGSRGREVREEITTKTMTTTSNQGGRGQSTGKKEIVKTVTNQVSESGSSQKRVRGGKEETTTTTTTTTTNLRSGNQVRSSQKEQTTTKTTTTNQRSGSRGPSQGQKVVKEVVTETSINRRNSGTQGTKTTTKTVTTAQGQGRASRTKETSSSELTTTKTTQINAGANSGRKGLKISQDTTVIKTAKVTESRDNERNGGNSTTKKTQRTLTNQKSTPALRVSNQVTSKTGIKDTTKRPLSSNTNINTSRDNIVRIYIDETGKIPKKTYVLNVRKLDRIQQDKRQRLSYSSKLDEKEAVQTNFNHNIIVIQNITKEPKKLDPNISNIAQIVINESSKIPKKQVQVSPRKNEIIKSVKKPLKFTYENYVETNTTSTTTLKKGVNKIPLPTTSKKMEVKTNLESRIGGGEQKSRGNSSSQKVETETKSSRIRTEGGKQTTTTTKTTTTTETSTRIGRNRSEANMNKGGSSESKVTITKTKITTGGKGGKYGQLEITSGNGKSINERSASSSRLKSESNSKGGSKTETITTKKVVTERTGSKSRSGGEGASGSKITTVKKTEISFGSGDKNSGNSKIRQESTTTTTKTVTKTSSKVESSGEGGGSVVRKFRSMRKMKK